MSGKWKTAAPGIRVRDHAARRHGVRPDRYFTLRFSVDGRQIEEALGWASAGWTLARAQEELGKIREAKRTAEAGTSCGLLHHMFRKALQWGLRPREAGNPLENVVEPKTSRRERLLAPGEIGALLKALERAATENTEEPQIIAAVHTVILTG